MNRPSYLKGSRLLLCLAWMFLMIVTPSANAAAPEDDYAKARLKVIETGQPLVVLAGASWCQPCRQIEPLIPRLRKEGVFVHLDVDKAPDLARVLQISRLPTVIVWRKVEERWVVTRATGAPAIKKLLEPTPPVKTNGDASVSAVAEAASGSGLPGARPSK